MTGQGLGPQDEARPERNAGNAFQASSMAVSEAFSHLYAAHSHCDLPMSGLFL